MDWENPGEGGVRTVFLPGSHAIWGAWCLKFCSCRNGRNASDYQKSRKEQINNKSVPKMTQKLTQIFKKTYYCSYYVTCCCCSHDHTSHWKYNLNVCLPSSHIGLSGQNHGGCHSLSVIIESESSYSMLPNSGLMDTAFKTPSLSIVTK